jgi:Spy/CpxP family protein refolding chaperone
MRRHFIAIFAMALTLIFAAVVSKGIAAHHDKGPKGHMMKSGHHGLRGFLELKLSESQQAELIKIIDKYHGEKMGLKEKKWEAKNKLNDAIYADTYNEEAIRKAAKEVSTNKEEMSVLRAKMFGELKKVLKPEQVELLREMKSEKYGHHGSKKHGGY